MYFDAFFSESSFFNSKRVCADQILSIVYLRNECSWNHEYLGSLSPKGFTLTLQETRSIHDSMNRSKIEFIFYI